MPIFYNPPSDWTPDDTYDEHILYAAANALHELHAGRSFYRDRPARAAYAIELTEQDVDALAWWLADLHWFVCRTRDGRTLPLDEAGVRELKDRLRRLVGSRFAVQWGTEAPDWGRLSMRRIALRAYDDDRVRADAMLPIDEHDEATSDKE